MTEKMFYRQLLEPGLPDLEQVRRLCLDQGAPESAERAGRIGGQRNKGVRRLLYSWAAVCCLLLLTVSALLWRPVPQELAAGSQATPSGWTGSPALNFVSRRTVHTEYSAAARGKTPAGSITTVTAWSTAPSKAREGCGWPSPGKIPPSST